MHLLTIKLKGASLLLLVLFIVVALPFGFVFCSNKRYSMNSREIRSILRSKLGSSFLGVFASDQVPEKVETLPAALVVNTDPSNKPGTHWVAVYIDSNNSADYFDSYGLKPKIPSVLQLLEACDDWAYNGKQIQGYISSVCGHYSVYFLLQRANGMSMDAILQKFGNDFEENDEAVTEWLNESFDMDTETYDTEFLLNQVCVALFSK